MLEGLSGVVVRALRASVAVSKTWVPGNGTYIYRVNRAHLVDGELID